MFCPQCGVSNSDVSKYCTSCGSRLDAAPQSSSQSMPEPVAAAPQATQAQEAPAAAEKKLQPHVDSHLVWAILVTLFCCLPFGIVSIVYAAQVDGKLATGDYDGARHSANTAKNWAWAAFGCGLVIIAIYLVYVLAVLGTAYSATRRPF